MKGTSISFDSNMTRRGFLAALAAGVATCALTPAEAFASVEGVTASSKSADELWQEAVLKAAEEGSPVFENIQSKSGSGVLARSIVSDGNDKNVTVGGVPDVLHAIAEYEVTSANRIGAVKKAWVHGTQSTATNCSYSYTKIDGNRTLAVRFTVTLRNIFGISQSFRVYSEYGVTGANGVITVTYL